MAPTLRSDLLAGQAAIVTGGARGLGLAIAQTLVANGARVCIADLDAEAAWEAAADLGDAATAFAADLVDPAAPQALVEDAVGTFGRLDIVVNNAGYSWDALVANMRDEQFQAMLDIHMVVPFRICRAAAPHLLRRDGDPTAKPYRKVVNVSSLAHSFGNAGAANYAAAKSGLVGMTRSLANEWGGYGVNVNAIAFGVMQTRLSEARTAGHSIQVDGRTVPIGVSAAGLRAMGAASGGPVADAEAPPATPLARPVPGAALGRAGLPQEGADAAFFLCSPLSDYVTGQVLTVSGGLRGALA